MKTSLVYGTDNRFLRVYGNLMLGIGAFFQNIGLRYGGIYHVEDLELEDDDL